MRQPVGFADGSKRVWRLLRSLYGLKQAPLAWFQRLSACLKAIGLTSPVNEHCCFFKKSPFVAVIIYVDDGIIFSEDPNDGHAIIAKLRDSFETNLITNGKFIGLEYEIRSDSIYLL